MTILVFLSYPKPAFQEQQAFIDKLKSQLEKRNLTPRTLGVTDYDMDAPLTAIRRMMTESNGVISIAFRRTFIKEGTYDASVDTTSASKPEEVRPSSCITYSLAFISSPNRSLLQEPPATAQTSKT